MVRGFELERWDGQPPLHVKDWAYVLVHDDVVIPGRVKSFSVISDDHRIKVELDPYDIFMFIQRTRPFTPEGVPLRRFIFGRTSQGGNRELFVVWDNGWVQKTDNPAEA